jgi:hypothetical protein
MDLSGYAYFLFFSKLPSEHTKFQDSALRNALSD